MIFNKNPLRQARNPNSQLPVSDDKVQEIVKNLGIYQPSQELEATIRVVGVAIEGLADKEEVEEAIDVIDGKVDLVDAKVDINTAAISSLEVQTGQNTANITSTNNDLQSYKATNNTNVSLLQTNVTTNTSDITLLKESQSTGQLGYTSWSDLLAVPGTTSGVLAQVIGDSGTHTDPVTSTVVPNSGQYRWTGAAWQWIRADAITSKLDTSAANPRTIDFLHRDGFVAGQITGPVGPDLTTPANLPYSVSAGQLLVAPLGTSTFIRAFGTGQRRYADATVQVDTEVVMDSMTAGTYGPFVGFGDTSASFRGVWYNNNGSLSLVDTAGAVIGGTTVTDTDAAFVAGQAAKLSIIVNGDGTATAIATNPAGAILRLNITGIPLGNIWAVWRRSALADTGKISRFHIQHTRATSPLKVSADANSVGGVFANGFLAENVDGLYAASNGAKSTQKWGIASGKLRMTSTITGIYLAKVGISRTDRSSVEYEAITTVTAGQGGALLAIGDDPATRLVFAYLTNGFVGALNSSNAVVAGGVQASMAYAVGDLAKVRVVVRPDNTGSVTAVNASGVEYTVAITGPIPTGTVWAAQRNAGTVEVNRITVVPIAGSQAGIEARVATIDTISNDWQTFKVLPDGYAGRTVEGWTCTGLDMIPSGGLKGFFATGDDGRLREGDGSPFVPAIHITDPQHSRIVMTIPGGYTGASLQGVSCDNLAASATIWAACSENGTIRNYALYGAGAGTEIVADRITMASLGITGFNPNALAFDSTRGTGRGALWVGSNSGTTVYCIDANPAAVTRILATITVVNNPDMFQLIGNKLIYQYGDNGTRANFRQYDLSTNVETAKWGPLNDALAPEGFYYHAASKTLFLMCDAGYHNSVSALKYNIVMQYKVTAP